MSEYQYYEFLAIDRPLDAVAREALREISSRAKISSTSFINEYSYGDFRGDPKALMRDRFDVHVYLASCGSRRLMIRVPERLVDATMLQACLRGAATAKRFAAGDNVILDIRRDELDSDWIDEDNGRMAALAPLRADLLAGDHRLLCLVWLMAVEDGTVDDDAVEPMAGIGPLTASLQSFADFMCIDPDLLAAAAHRVNGSILEPISASEIRAAIAGLSEERKLTLLSRAHDGDPHVGMELRAAVRCLARRNAETSGQSLRTVTELWALAETIAHEREAEKAFREAEARARKAREEEQARRERLTALARRGEWVWRDVETEIERRNASAYDRAADLLFDLRGVAEQRDTVADFASRLGAIRARHASKGKFIQRIAGLG